MSETTDPPEDASIPEPDKGLGNGLPGSQAQDADGPPPPTDVPPLEERELPSDLPDPEDFDAADFQPMDGVPAGAPPIGLPPGSPEISSTANPQVNWGGGTSTLKNLKVPPHSLEAERAVLGGVMLDNNQWFNVLEVASATDFYRPAHQIIFEAMSFLAEDNQPLDVVTVSTRLQHSGLLEKAGSAIYLAEIAEETPGASNVVAYAKIVRERSTLRQLLGAANRIAESAFNPDGQATADLVNNAEAEIFRISEGRMKREGLSPSSRCLRLP